MGPSASRRQFLRATAGAGALLASGALTFLWSPRVRADKFGELLPDPDGILDLPEGFSYRIIERGGDPMDDGYVVPGLPDGMACFTGEPGTLVLMRNHELSPGDTARSPFANGQAVPPEVYAAGSVGGVTRLVVDSESFERVSSNLVLVGTDRNCAGGFGPGGWLTCEETVAAGHGYVFQCSPNATGVQAPLRITGCGRFRHEAATWDPSTGIIYLTEDQGDGCLYRFVPFAPEDLLSGQLQALRISGADGFNTGAGMTVGEPLPCDWVDIDQPDPVEDTVRVEALGKGAAIVVRGEGLHWEDGNLYVVSTTGGVAGAGQIFRYVPGASVDEGGSLELIAEAGEQTNMANPDNIVMGPSGDLYIAEDNLALNYLRVLDGEGKAHEFARNSLSNSEFAGLCFSPDGAALFVNIWADDLTLVITGPFGRPDGGGSGSGGVGSGGVGSGTDSGSGAADPGKEPPDAVATTYVGEATAECACTAEEPGRSVTRGAALAMAAWLGISRRPQ